MRGKTNVGSGGILVKGEVKSVLASGEIKKGDFVQYLNNNSFTSLSGKVTRMDSKVFEIDEYTRLIFYFYDTNGWLLSLVDVSDGYEVLDEEVVVVGTASQNAARIVYSNNYFYILAKNVDGLKPYLQKYAIVDNTIVLVDRLVNLSQYLNMISVLDSGNLFLLQCTSSNSMSGNLDALYVIIDYDTLEIIDSGTFSYTCTYPKVGEDMTELIPFGNNDFIVYSTSANYTSSLYTFENIINVDEENDYEITTKKNQVVQPITNSYPITLDTMLSDDLLMSVALPTPSDGLVYVLQYRKYSISMLNTFAIKNLLGINNSIILFIKKIKNGKILMGIDSTDDLGMTHEYAKPLIIALFDINKTIGTINLIDYIYIDRTDVEVMGGTIYPQGFVVEKDENAVYLCFNCYMNRYENLKAIKLSVTENGITASNKAYVRKATGGYSFNGIAKVGAVDGGQLQIYVPESE